MSTLTEIRKNPHFNQLAAILQVAMSQTWHEKHKIPVRERFEQLVKLLPDSSVGAFDKTKFVTEWNKLFIELTVADPKLQYSDEDMHWFASVLDGKQTIVTLSMLFAMASTPPMWFTLEQISNVVNKPAVTLRKRAAEGEFPALIIGKTYAASYLMLRAYGIEMPLPDDESEGKRAWRESLKNSDE